MQDSQTTKLFWIDKMLEDYVDMCIGEIYAGNHPTFYFNKVRWKNIITKFNEIISKEF